MSSPDNRRIKNRRDKLKKTWRSAEYRKKVKEFIGEQKCCWCGGDTYLTVHHPYRTSYTGDIYTDLELANCIILCRSCHFMLHKGFDKCSCGKHYKPFERELCFSCYCEKFPEVQEKINRMKEQKKELQKQLRKEAYQKAKQYKKEHPTKMNNVNIKKKNGVS